MKNLKDIGNWYKNSLEFQVDGMRVEEVREAVKFAREYAVREGPIIIEVETYRYFGHSMSDPGTAYRTREEVKAVQDQHDPIKNFTALLEEKGLKSKEDIEVCSIMICMGFM